MILPWGSTLKISKGCPPRRVVPGISAVFVVLPPDFHRTWFTLPSPLFFLDLPLYCLPLWQSGSQVFSWWSSGWGKAGSSLGQNYMGGGDKSPKFVENRWKSSKTARKRKNFEKSPKTARKRNNFLGFYGGGFRVPWGGDFELFRFMGGIPPPSPPH